MRTQKLFLALTILISFVGCVRTPVTGKNVFILTSESQEAQLGEDAYKQTLAKTRTTSNGKWSEILQRVGGRIAAVAEKPSFKWEFRLIDSKEKNAFCLPGGKVAFYTGIIPEFKNEAQMAAVMGHEVAHATARHGGQRITVQFGTALGFEALSLIMGGGDTQQKKLLLQAIGLGATVGAILPFSRAHESEADHIGIMYMAKAGYDPREAPVFWQNFGRERGGPPEWLSTHPSSGNREENLKRLLPEAMAIYERSPKHGTGEPLP
jgi:metalloendopeptidase OMA1, mitochondrial